LIAQFRQNTAASKESPELYITQEEWIAFWEGVKYRMLCTSHTMHFGTWKAVALRYIILEFDALLTNTPIQKGYSPAWWRTAVDVLLLKKVMVILIEKLWTIVLFQGDFNYMNKFIGQKMMKNNEFYDQLK
jgi:hypothetical protein